MTPNDPRWTPCTDHPCATGSGRPEPKPPAPKPEPKPPAPKPEPKPDPADDYDEESAPAM